MTIVAKNSQREMALTAELVALCFREERDPGPDGRWTELSDQDYRNVAVSLDADIPKGPLWVFAYGSLIWKPAFLNPPKRDVLPPLVGIAHFVWR